MSALRASRRRLLLGLVALLAGACGLKGDPIRPGSKEDLERQKKKQQQSQGG